MFYTYVCDFCGCRFERGVSVENRDLPQACQQCGSGAKRVFEPRDVLVSWTFNECMISDIQQTKEQARAQESENDRYLASKPAEKPTFEQCVVGELDKRGIRHPNRLIEP